MFKTKQQPVSANLLLSSVRYLITNPTRQVQQLFTTKKATSKRIPIRSQKALFSPFIYILRRLTLKPKTAATFISYHCYHQFRRLLQKHQQVETIRHIRQKINHLFWDFHIIIIVLGY